jgi:hypothetical protein
LSKERVKEREKVTERERDEEGERERARKVQEDKCEPIKGDQKSPQVSVRPEIFSLQTKPPKNPNSR